MAPPDRRGPKALGDVLGSLFASKGFARLRAAQSICPTWLSLCDGNVTWVCTGVYFVYGTAWKFRDFRNFWEFPM